jgi:hypothetical protein
MQRKLYLQPISDNHIYHYMGLSDDPELIESMVWRPFEIDEKDRFLSTIEILTLPYCGNGNAIAFSILTALKHIPIGYVSLKGIDQGKKFAELGIAIVNGNYRSSGPAATALMRLILLPIMHLTNYNLK